MNISFFNISGSWVYFRFPIYISGSWVYFRFPIFCASNSTDFCFFLNVMSPVSLLTADYTTTGFHYTTTGFHSNLTLNRSSNCLILVSKLWVGPTQLRASESKQAGSPNQANNKWELHDNNKFISQRVLFM